MTLSTAVSCRRTESLTFPAWRRALLGIKRRCKHELRAPWRTRLVGAALVTAAARFFGLGGKDAGTSGGGRALGGGRPAHANALAQNSADGALLSHDHIRAGTSIRRQPKCIVCDRSRVLRRSAAARQSAGPRQVGSEMASTGHAAVNCRQDGSARLGTFWLRRC